MQLAPAPRMCYLHAGTHKTGTTYIQTFLQWNRSVLAGEGLYVPSAGRVGPSGHHNIPWSSAGDTRYDPAAGGLNELVGELSSVQPPCVCVSSEDFEYLAQTPATLRTIRTKLNEIGYNVKILFFLRPQADYAESLYAEAVRHGLRLDFLEFLDVFAQGGCYEGLMADYSVLLDSFADVFGFENIIVRRYKKSAKPERLLIDFFSPILPKFRFDSGKYRVNSFKENETIPFSQVFQLFVGNNLHPAPHSVLVDPVSLASSVRRDRGGHRYLHGRFDPVDLKDVLTKFWKLAGSNFKVMKKYHVFIPFVSGPAIARDVLGLLYPNANSRKRRFLIDRFPRNSPDLNRVLSQLYGTDGDRSLDRVNESEVSPNLEQSENAAVQPAPTELDTLRTKIRANEQHLKWLNEELAQRDRELHLIKSQTARALAQRDREIARIQQELIRVQMTATKATSAAAREFFGRSRLKTLYKGLKLLWLFFCGQASACRDAMRRSAGNLKDLRRARIIRKSGLFDASFYLMQNPELKGSGVDPILHFVRHGSVEDLDPHPLFDSSYYLDHSRDLLGAGCNPLMHFLKSGSREGRDPHPLFDTSYYWEHNPDVARSGLNPLLHFAKYGGHEGRNPCALFDVSYYTEQNPELANGLLNPLVHFLEHGLDARDPHPLFDSSYYLSENPDVATQGINPLLHFALRGALEGRNPHPLFDCSYYRQQSKNFEGKAFDPTIQFVVNVNPLAHFLEYGVHEGRSPHPLFDTSFYLKNNPDVARAGINPLIHFIQRGAYEGRDPCSSFSVSTYMKENPEIAKARLNPLVHFVMQNREQRRLLL